MIYYLFSCQATLSQGLALMKGRRKTQRTGTELRRRRNTEWPMTEFTSRPTALCCAVFVTYSSTIRIIRLPTSVDSKHWDPPAVHSGVSPDPGPHALSRRPSDCRTFTVTSVRSVMHSLPGLTQCRQPRRPMAQITKK